MGQILIRNIPDEVLARFKSEAKRQGKSAEQFAREAIHGMAENDGQIEFWSLADRIRGDSGYADLETVKRVVDECKLEQDGEI